MSSPPSVSVGRIAGRYVVEREIGRGATSIVYLARDPVRDQAVAVKVLRADLMDVGAAHRFLREVRRHSGLAHPSIVPVLDAGEHDGQLYCVLPYMEGGTLRARLEREKQLPIADAVTIARTVAEALEYAHGQGLIHRDVKPENILFTNGSACLADFGIARALESAFDDTTTTSSSIVRGTVAYMSPEQASGERDYDGRSDVYSLGCVLYEMLAGVPAFIGPTPEATLAQRFIHPPRAIGVYRPSIPSSVEAVVMKALQIAPADRFGSAGELAQALSEAVQGPEVRPAPAIVPALGRPARPRYRRWWAVAVAAGLAVAAAVVVGRQYAGPGLDPSRYAVMPFLTTEAGLSESGLLGDDYQVLLHDALAYWEGVELVDRMSLRSAYEQHVHGAPDIDGALRTARKLGAGRVVWGDVRRIGDSTHLRAGLYDVAKGGRPIQEARVRIGADHSDLFAKLEALARSLLFGDDATSAAAGLTGTRSVEAGRAYIEGHRALRTWDLASARRHFERAIRVDAEYPHAHVWLVQTSRLEGATASPAVREAAAQAVRLRDRLAPPDQEVALALYNLSDGRFEDACKRYRAILARDSVSFLAWYGLGECQALDPVVEADARSPSGWRFRSSPTAAIQAFTRALELTPSVYRAFRGRSFERLARLFYVETARSKRGYRLAEHDTLWYLAFPALAADTVVFVPYSIGDLRAGKYTLLPPSHAAAVARNRTILRNVTERWAQAFPESPDAAESHARALEAAGELTGDGALQSGALAVIQRARGLASDPDQQFRLAAAEVRLRLKVGDYAAAAATADSLLERPIPRDGDALQRAAALAALRGKVDRAAALLAEYVAVADPPSAQMLPDGTRVPVPPAVLQPALALYVYAAHGGPRDSIRALWNRVEAAVRTQVPAEQRERVSLAVLYDAAALAYATLGPTPLHRRPPAGAFGLLSVQIAAMRGDTAPARARVDSNVAQQRLDPSRTIHPPSASEYARLVLAAGDTARAAAMLDALIEGLAFRPEAYFHAPVNVALIIRAMAARAELAAASRDTARALRWSRAVASLWSGADPVVRPAVDRVQKIVSQYGRFP